MASPADKKWEQAKQEGAAAAKDAADAAGMKYQETKDAAYQKASDLKDSASQKYGDAKDTASQKFEDVRNAERSYVQQAKDGVASAAHSVKDAVSGAVDAVTHPAAPGHGIDMDVLEQRVTTSPDGADIQTETPPTLEGKHL